MDGKALAIANNDLVYLWWTYPEKIPDCLGFTIHRLEKGKAAAPLPAYVGFEPKKSDRTPPEHHTTDYWPVQSYQWKDLFVPEEKDVAYEIIPVTGKPGEKLKELSDLAIRTDGTKATDTLGRYRVIFNQGIVSTQSLSKKLRKWDEGKLSAEKLRDHISDPKDPIRKQLAGEAPGALVSLLERAKKEGGTCYAALYELTDKELTDALANSKGHVRIILSNADSSETGADKKTKKIYDGTNKEAREKLHDVLGDDIIDRLLPKGNYIGHNKFVVFTDGKGKPKTVLTGSTNWTCTGLCAQSNNILIIDDETIASQYLDYWHRLADDQGKQGPEFRKANAAPLPRVDMGAGEGTIQLWFTPDMKQKTKPKGAAAPPPDMDEVFEAIRGAKHGALFLLFNAGEPSILDCLEEVSQSRRKEKKEFFVRGAVSDAKTSDKFATRVYNDSLLDAPNTLITGIGGVPDAFSYWEKEIAKLGYAVIHDKILVLDFRDPENCTVITGSHNLGYKASYSNDENYCIIRGNRAIAESYTAHVLDIVNHYNWRYKLNQDKKKGKSPAGSFTDLDESDNWQNKYFQGNFLKNRDLFFFPGAR